MSDSEDTMQEAITDLQRAYESMMNTAQFQTATNGNLILNLAPTVKAIKTILEELDTEPEEEMRGVNCSNCGSHFAVPKSDDSYLYCPSCYATPRR